MYWLLDIVIENQLDSIWESCVLCIQTWQSHKSVIFEKKMSPQNKMKFICLLLKPDLIATLFSYRRQYNTNWLWTAQQSWIVQNNTIKIWFENIFWKHLHLVHRTRMLIFFFHSWKKNKIFKSKVKYLLKLLKTSTYITKIKNYSWHAHPTL